MTTFNEDLRNFILKRAHDIQKFENGSIAAMQSYLHIAKSEIEDELDRLVSLGSGKTLAYRISRAEVRINEINSIFQIANINAANKLETNIYDLAVEDSELYPRFFNSRLSGIGIEFSSLPLRQIDFAASNPLYAESLKDKMLWANETTMRFIKNELMQSIIQGEDMSKTINRLLGKGNRLGGFAGKKALDKAAIVARTEIQYVSNQVARAVYNENQDILKGVMYTATLDNRTCLQCANLDGQVYLMKGVDHKGPILPLHPFCRCFYAPITYSWAELEKRHNIKINKEKRGYFSGSKMDTLTYSEWFKTLPESEQLNILGATRYKSYKDGKLKLKQMANSRKIYTIDDLKRKYKNI